MAKFMINICYGDLEVRKKSVTTPEARAALMQKYNEWTSQLGSKVLFAHKLKDGQGRRIQSSEGQIKDGPYTETKEGIGGFYIVSAESYDEAVSMAKACPSIEVQGAYVDVREVEF